MTIVNAGLPVVNGYIDGYNFYRPIQKKAKETRDPALLRLAWCNYYELVKRLAVLEFGHGRVGVVKLFTAYARDNVRRLLDSRGLERKQHWLEALYLETKGRLHISYGRWEGQPHNPNQPKEKLTDVKLAISLVQDALWPRERAANPRPALFDHDHLYDDDDPPAPFDRAILISGDKDFLPAAEMVIRDARKEVTVVFPYLSDGYSLPPGAKVRTRVLQEADLRACFLPTEIHRPDGTKITWRDYVLSKGWRLDGN